MQEYMKLKIVGKNEYKDVEIMDILIRTKFKYNLQLKSTKQRWGMTNWGEDFGTKECCYTLEKIMDKFDKVKFYNHQSQDIYINDLKMYGYIVQSEEKEITHHSMFIESITKAGLIINRNKYGIDEKYLITYKQLEEIAKMYKLNKVL